MKIFQCEITWYFFFFFFSYCMEMFLSVSGWKGQWTGGWGYLTVLNLYEKNNNKKKNNFFQLSPQNTLYYLLHQKHVTVFFSTTLFALFEPRHEKTRYSSLQNKDADQLCRNCTADQRLCFRYTDSTIPLLPKSGFSGF